MKYNKNSSDSIIAYAKKLKDHTLRELCIDELKNHDYHGKGKFGQLLEKYYFEYEPNSLSEPDFPEAGLELKSSPLKILKNGEFQSKERVVLNIINFMKVHKEDFKSSSFYKKNAHILFVFFVYIKDVNIIDYLIHIVDDWKFPYVDLRIIQQDWERINLKIKEGKAHEISEGDTFYLGACTKGSTAERSLRNQPFNDIQAKQRAYSLKQSYVNHIISILAKDKKVINTFDADIPRKHFPPLKQHKAKLVQKNYHKKNILKTKTAKLAKGLIFERIIKTPELLDKYISIEDLIISKFEPYYGKNPREIESIFGLSLNRRSKSYYASLTKSMLGIGLDNKIEEFEKADIIVKTVRLKESNLPKESISFPAFKYEEIVAQEWEDSNFFTILSSKFFFVFYRFEGNDLIFQKTKFWNMPYKDIEEAKKVWLETRNTITNGKIIKQVLPHKRLTYFPKSIDNKVSHVRPHATTVNDCYPLPVPDILTGDIEYSKHSFWLNANYIKNEIFLK